MATAFNSLSVPPEIVVCVCDTFDNILEIEIGFTNFLEESCK